MNRHPSINIVEEISYRLLKYMKDTRVDKTIVDARHSGCRGASFEREKNSVASAIQNTVTWFIIHKELFLTENQLVFAARMTGQRLLHEYVKFGLKSLRARSVLVNRKNGLSVCVLPTKGHIQLLSDYFERRILVAEEKYKSLENAPYDVKKRSVILRKALETKDFDLAYIGEQTKLLAKMSKSLGYGALLRKTG